MRTRLLVGTLFILSLPLLCSTQVAPNAVGRYRFAAMAGHTQFGEWCQCGSGGCTCDAGELPLAPASIPRRAATRPIEAGDRHAPAGTGLAMLVLALIMLARMLL